MWWSLANKWQIINNNWNLIFLLTYKVEIRSISMCRKTVSYHIYSFLTHHKNSHVHTYHHISDTDKLQLNCRWNTYLQLHILFPPFWVKWQNLDPTRIELIMKAGKKKCCYFAHFYNIVSRLALPFSCFYVAIRLNALNGHKYFWSLQTLLSLSLGILYNMVVGV